MNVKEKRKTKMDGRSPDFAWASAVAQDFVRRRGCLVVETDPRRLAGGRKPAVDFVAWHEQSDEMLFVRVVLCRSDDTASAVKSRLPTRARMAKAKREARRWSEHPDIRWKGKRRFDSITVYGDVMTKRPTVDWTVGVKGEL